MNLPDPMTSAANVRSDTVRWPSRPRICILGAGAIGGFFGARLALGNADVSVLARGATLNALQEQGWTLESAGQTTVARVNAVASTQGLGVQDLVFLTVKAYALGDIAGQIAPLLGPHTLVIPAINGVPWWFAGGVDHRLHALQSVDPHGRIAAAIPIGQVIGSVVYPACSTPAPGVCRHASGTRLVFGEIGTALSSPRTSALVAFLNSCGFDAEFSTDIRVEVWKKLLGNACFNPVSLITGSATDLMINDPAINALFVTLMHETIAVGRALGLEVGITPTERIAITRKLGHVKTSMLQDAQAGRKVELDAILGAVIELARRTNTLTPASDTVFALAKMRAQILGLI
jgi:2-dehydropantoate 2-reductase